MSEARAMRRDLAAAAVRDAADDLSEVIGLRAGQPVQRGQWLARVDAWQAAFAAQPGTRWALLIDDAIEFGAALFGAWHAGKRVVLPADAQPHTLKLLAEVTDGMAGELPGGLQAASAAPPQLRRTLDAQGTELLLFTSGSGGQPVPIPKRLQQLRAEIEAQHALFGQRWAAERDLLVWATVSHQHIYGLLFVVLWPLAAGARVAMPRLVYPEEMAARIGPGPALLVSSPAHLKRLTEAADWHQARTGLRAALSSGGPLPPEAAAEAGQRLGVAPIEVYGSSETGGIAWRQRAEHGERWNPIPGVQWRIADGVLAVQSPFLPDAAWFETADRVRADEAGGFVLLGRADRIVKVEDRRFSLTAIERALLDSPWVAEVRVFPHGGINGRLAAAVVPSARGAQALAEQGRRAFTLLLHQALTGRIERTAWPRRWRVVDALPANAQGKVTEAALQVLLAEPPPWQWLERGNAQARAQRLVEADLAVFEGHFPQGAILPGVVQLDWVLEAAREAFGVAAPVTLMESLKFRMPVRPPLRLTLELTWSAERSRLAFQLTSRQGVHASGRLQFAPASGGA